MKISAYFAARFLIVGIVAATQVVPALAQQKDTLPQITAYQEERPVWDKSAGFGPVPKNLQAIGDAECQKVKFDRAVGYSKRTLNPDGKTFEKGGFMCQNDPKSNS